MIFTSPGFFVFLAIALAVFALLPARARWAWLLAASAAFYGWAHPSHLAYLAAVAVVVWAASAGMARADTDRARRAWLAAGLAVVLGALVLFKFHDFCAGEIERIAREQGRDWALPRLGVAAPAGFSFYVFSAASFLVDAFARRIPPAATPGAVALYLGWFPKILAGPIERATEFLPRLADCVRPSPQQVVLATQMIGWGLVKKVAIADNLAPFVDRTFAIAAYASPVDLLVSIYFFAFQIYCDFSGYTDIALGVSLLFGLPLMENFRRPYLSRSTTEFWGERWHISLGRWFRDYLFIPLGGSRAGTPRRLLNIMVVFTASGLWHAGLGYGVGWTFLVWGALNGGYQCAGIALRPLANRLARALPRVADSAAWHVVRVLFTFHLVAFAWIFFRARTLGDAWAIVRKLAAQFTRLPELLANYPFTGEQRMGLALIGLLVAVEIFDERRSLYERLAALPVALRWAACYAALATLLLLGRWQGTEFIYMQF